MEIVTTPTSGRRTAVAAAALISRLGPAHNQRRLSAYKFFMREVLDELRREYPDGSIVLPIVSRLCAQRWVTLDPRVKQRFQDSVDAFEERRTLSLGFPVQKPAPAAPAPARSKGDRVSKAQKPPKKKQKVIPGGPKRPLSAFVYFCKENRRVVKDKNPALNICEVTQELGRIWNSLNANEKWHYNQTSMIDRNRYSQEMAVFKQNRAIMIKMEPVDEEDSEQEGYGLTETKPSADFIKNFYPLDETKGGMMDSGKYPISSITIKQEY